MKGRPPVKPSHQLRRKSSDEENDKVEELGNFAVPSSRTLQNFTPIPISSYFETLLWCGSTPVYWSGSSGPIFLCFHGAGLSASSFAPITSLTKPIPCQLVSFDFKAHGQNLETEAEYNLTSSSLISEGLRILQFTRETSPNSKIVLLGHSMGGAIASKVALADQSQGGKLEGLIIVDVVEGQALSALPHMETIINQKPKVFRSVEKAIEWAYCSNTIRNLQSARASVPMQVRDGEGGVVWRTDLKRTQGFWEDWFRGMNNAFLGFQGPKELIIAASDRVDNQMMIAQMQGKYKHKVIFNVGHMIQEDNPEDFANEIRDFICTFKIR